MNQERQNSHASELFSSHAQQQQPMTTTLDEEGEKRRENYSQDRLAVESLRRDQVAVSGRRFHYLGASGCSRLAGSDCRRQAAQLSV